ncbi:hypothetical protein [Candidatus Phytoplasma luffae]|nr:hypothetical protein [Candidatus Phytoplasma luffae]
MKKKFINKKKNTFFKIYSLILLIISLIVFIFHLKNNFFLTKSGFGKNFCNTFKHFTSQSNFFILIILILFFTPFFKNKYFHILTFITLINILLTFIVNHSFIAPDEKRKLFQNIINFEFPGLIHFQHTFIPILYIIFYFFSLNKGIDVKKSYLGIIYPLFYFLFFLILNFFKSEKYYPYDFINPDKKGIFELGQKQGYLGLFLSISVLTLVFYFLSFFILFLKKKFK